MIGLQPHRTDVGLRCKMVCMDGCDPSSPLMLLICEMLRGLFMASKQKAVRQLLLATKYVIIWLQESMLQNPQVAVLKAVGGVGLFDGWWYLNGDGSAWWKFSRLEQ